MNRLPFRIVRDVPRDTYRERVARVLATPAPAVSPEPTAKPEPRKPTFGRTTNEAKGFHIFRRPSCG